MSRAFIDTNGAAAYTTVEVEAPAKKAPESLPERAAKAGSFKEQVKTVVSDLSVASQKGLVEMFDSTIGASTVLLPFGGKRQMTPIQTMAAKLPVENGETKTASLMAYGYDPYVSSWSPFHGAEYAVMESVAKVVAVGGDYRKIRFSFQEFFERMSEDPKRWGKPFAALLGGYEAQKRLGLPSIGGKDSMSGSFNDIDVPPTLVSIAVDWTNTDEIVTPEFKEAGDKAVLLCVEKNPDETIKIDAAMALYDKVLEAMKAGKIKAAYAVTSGGVIEAVVKMAMGNGFGFAFCDEAKEALAQAPVYGSLVVETNDDEIASMGLVLGGIAEVPEFTFGDESITLAETEEAYTGKLERV